MKVRFALFSLALSSCASTSSLADSQPAAVYHSSKVRHAVSECLLARMGGIGVKPEITEGAVVTTLRFTSLHQWTNPGLYLFTVRDEGTGSTVEARTPSGFAKLGLPTAETCF